MVLTCRHCGKRNANRPRGLCWGCYYTHGVKAMYGISDSKYAYRGSGQVPATVLPSPTHHPPGTPEKLAVLAERARRNERLWHPDDTKQA